MNNKNKICISISGGKDSTACLLLALKKYDRKDIIPIFADTNFEHPFIYSYLDYLENKLKIKIERVQSQNYLGLIDCMRKRKMFPSGHRRFCTYELKLRPIWKFVSENNLQEGEMWIGIRSNESRQRKERYEKYKKIKTIDYIWLNPKILKKLRKMQVRLPVLNYSAIDCFNVIKKSNIEINPLYKMGFERVGCFPCIISGLKSYKQCWQNSEGKKNIQKLFDLEKWFNDRGNRTRIKDNANRYRLKKLFKMEDDKLYLFELRDEERCSYCNI